MLALSGLSDTKSEKASSETAQNLGTGQSAKNAKAKGLAGLFAELLSQTQKLNKSSAGAASDASKLGEAKLAEGKGLLPSASQQKGKAAIPVKTDAAASKNGKASGTLPLVSKANAGRAQTQALPEKQPESSLASALPTLNMAKKALEDSKAKNSATESPPEGKAAEDKKQPKSPLDAPAILLPAQLQHPKPAQLSLAKAKTESGDKEDPSSRIEGADERKKAAATEVQRPQLSIVDMRKAAARQLTPADAAGNGSTDGKSKEGSAELASFHPDANRPASHEVHLDLPSLTAGIKTDVGGGEVKNSTAPSADFRSLLAERLQDQWNADIVRSAHIVLRDGDSGTIRLRLRPESLGNVKIELNLSDNNINGKIVVESDEAKNAFEKNMNSLSDAFKQGGFDSARLEVSVGSGSGGGAQSQSGQGDSSSGPFYSERLREAVASSSEPAMASQAYSRRGMSLDILA